MIKVIKKLVLGLLLIMFFFFLPRVVIARTDSVYPQGYVVNNFKSEILINQDTSIDIVETIEVEYFQEKHGIFRIIPTTYSSKGKTIKAKFEVKSIYDELGSAHPYSLSKLGQSIKLKIGDPNKTISGKRTYIIGYKIKKVLQRFENYDEFYWNVTGSEWDTHILKAEAVVETPFAQVENVDCFTGVLGMRDNLCRTGYSKNTATFNASDLGNGKDFSIVVGLNKNNSILFPGIVDRTIQIIFDNWGYLFTFLPLLLIFRLWYRRGRDRRYLSDNVYYKPDKVNSGTVSLFSRPHLPLVYHPLDGLSPSEVGTIVDEKVNIHDVIAEIVELARLGFIKIEQIKVKKLIGKSNEYAFIKTEKYSDKNELSKLKDYQKYLLRELFRSTYIAKSVSTAEKLFEKDKGKLNSARNKLAKKEYVLLSALKNNLYKGLSVYKKKLYKRMESEGFFSENPDKSKAKWIGIYIGIVFMVSIVLIVFSITTYNFGPLLLYPLIFVGGLFFAISMPRRTPKGYSLYRQIKGLKWYLDKGKWRYEHMEKKLFFEEILPLAIALRTVDKISEEMKDIGIQPPSYFGGSDIDSFSRDFGKFYGVSTASFLSSPKSSGWSGKSSWSGGSGFSGGGFGGGGGGSW